MLQKLLLSGLCAFATACPAEEPPPRLPQPQYERKDSDPAWLEHVVRFHGHLGPSVVAGARVGMAGVRAVDAKGYFDVEVTCEGPFAKPPQSCFLDGLQVATGATMGKRTLTWVEAERIVVRVRNTSSGKTAEVRPSPKLLELLASLQPGATIQRHDKAGNHAKQDPQQQRLEAVARQIALMAEKEILSVTFAK